MSEIDELRKMVAQGGTIAAMCMLGLCLLDDHPDGTPATAAEREEAFMWMSRAAARGGSRAKYHLGRMHAHGIGTPQNVGLARQVLTAAAERGEWLAVIEMARLELAHGGGEEAARAWYKQAVDTKDGIHECEELVEAVAFVDRWESQERQRTPVD